MDVALGIFVASLAGSPHCAAMCGPFLAFGAADDGTLAVRRRTPLVAYHGGRLTAYLILGVIAGTLGAGVERLGHLAGIGRAAAIVSGALMIAWGLNAFLVYRGAPTRLHAPLPLQRWLSGVVRRVRDLPGSVRGGVIGLATSLLPCGWLYAFVAAAGGTGSPAKSALVMALFWTGTLPMLVTMGFGLQRLAGPARRHLPLVTASLVVAIGLFTMAGRLRVPVPHAGAPAPSHAGHR
jgi:sulfite exporter TauE/SafE